MSPGKYHVNNLNERGDWAVRPGFGGEGAWKQSVGYLQKMAKRQLDPFFVAARDSTPKPHAHGPVAVRGLIKPVLFDITKASHTINPYCYYNNSKQLLLSVT